MRFNKSKILILAVFSLLLTSCSRRPVLYENGALQRTGRDLAEHDIDDCMERAEAAGAKGDSRGTKAAKDAGVGAAAGAAAATVGSAILDGALSGRVIGAGAGAGAAGSLIYGLFRNNPDPVFERYVNLCLEERGYDPIGWK
jgi:hypothetical protein